jgi:ribosome assembly protein RRB1
MTSDDGECTLWDLSLERDPSEEKEVIGELFERPDLTRIPDQLMFQHQGLEHPKEAHWHNQIPGMVITTDFFGLHLFKPMNWRSLMK